MKSNLADENIRDRMTHTQWSDMEPSFFIHEAIEFLIKCDQRRLRRVCASAQTRLSRRCPPANIQSMGAGKGSDQIWNILCAQKHFFDCQSFYKYFLYRSTFNVQAQLTRWTKSLVLGWSFHLCPYFVYANSECSDETAHICTSCSDSSLFAYAII